MANTKVDNAAKGTESYANSMQLQNNALFNIKKRKGENFSYGKVIQKSCN